MSPIDPEHERLLDSLGAYALEALTAEERAEVDGHLERCASCRKEVEVLSAVVHHLPSAAPQVAPPVQLRTRIMTQIEAEAELMRAAGSNADRVPGRRWAPAAALLFRPLGAAVAAGLLLVVAVAAFLAGGATRRPQPTPVRTVAAHVQRSLAPHASASLMLRRGGGATLVVSRLPEPPRGRIYEVWLVRRGRDAPAPTDALFTVNGRGSGHVEVPGDLRRVERILVTAEPRGGSDVPSQLVPLISAPTS